MRSCARRILEAATISMALVILRVFCTLLILTRISLVLGISSTWKILRARRGSSVSRRLSVGRAGQERLDRLGQGRLVVLGQVLGAREQVDQRLVVQLEIVAQRPLRLQRLGHGDLVEV